jgi:hypothetical protein
VQQTGELVAFNMLAGRVRRVLVDGIDLAMVDAAWLRRRAFSPWLRMPWAFC